MLFFSFSFRYSVPLVTRSTLEVVIPDPAVPKLITKSKNKLAQISEVRLANSYCIHYLQKFPSFDRSNLSFLTCI